MDKKNKISNKISKSKEDFKLAANVGYEVTRDVFDSKKKDVTIKNAPFEVKKRLDNLKNKKS